MGAEHPVRRNKTARELANRFEVTPRTIQRLMAEPRKEYEGRAAERRRRIIELRAQGRTYEQIAAELGMSASGVGVTVHRMRKAGVKV